MSTFLVGVGRRPLGVVAHVGAVVWVGEGGYRLADLDDVGGEHLSGAGAEVSGVVGHPEWDEKAVAGVEEECGLVLDLHLYGAGDVVHGILPASLSRGGLHAGLESLIADFTLPVELDVDIPRLATDVEITAYFIVAETLTNVIKHARATATSVKVTISDGNLDIEVRDDGVGGADPSQGSGLTGLLDRVEASNGTLAISSPIGKGTTVNATIPISVQAATAR